MSVKTWVQRCRGCEQDVEGPAEYHPICWERWLSKAKSYKLEYLKHNLRTINKIISSIENHHNTGNQKEFEFDITLLKSVMNFDKITHSNCFYLSDEAHKQIQDDINSGVIK